MAKTWTHRALCELAVKWLKRPVSREGHGCQVAICETRSGWSGEVPDAIGFRNDISYSGSVVVEVKTSRSDFLCDAKKPHRLHPETGIGSWRYYMCPEGLIQPEELPEKFGLLYVNSRGHIKTVRGPMIERNYYQRRDALENMQFPVNTKREMFLLVALFKRIGDANAVSNKLKEAYRINGTLNRKVLKLADENRTLQWQLLSLKQIHE